MNLHPLPALGATGLALALIFGQPMVPIAFGGVTADPSPAINGPSAPTEAADPADDPTAGTTWALQPAQGGAPDGRVSLRHRVEPGAFVAESLALSNFGAEPATFAVYASDGVVGRDGSFDLIPAGQDSVDGGAWVALGAVDGATPREDGGFAVSVPAGETVAVSVRIEIPADASPGDHPAGIVAELLPDAASEVQLASRVGVRVHLRVSGDIMTGVRPQALQASYEPSWNPFAPGILTVRYDLTNTGNVRVGAQTVVDAAGPFGLVASDQAADPQREILPGQSVAAQVEMPMWPVFFVDGRAVATPDAVGDDEIEGTMEAGVESFTAWTVPWSQLVHIVLAVSGVLLFHRLRTRSAARVQARIDAAVAAAQGARSGDPS
ncbi:MAG: hypothetical protein P0Y60_17320 [Candidatus Microbacterium colombiense]|nr:MAG: hypothetical protein P0Y60_17320 [Microbacterium sp.]